MPKIKVLILDLRKRIVDTHKAGNGYTKLSLRFQVPRTGVKSIIRQFKESHTAQKKAGRGRKGNVSGEKTDERCV